jgi:hypothetical protein
MRGHARTITFTGDTKGGGAVGLLGRAPVARLLKPAEAVTTDRPRDRFSGTCYEGKV